MSTYTKLTLFYDGYCPICQREIAWLQSRNQRGLLIFQEIHAEDFDPEKLGFSLEELMAEIHGVTDQGLMIKGVDVFYLAYKAVGLAWLVAPLQWSWSRPIFLWAYSIFARYRLPLTARFFKRHCQQGQCKI